MTRSFRKFRSVPACFVAFLIIVTAAAAFAPSSSAQTNTDWTGTTGNWSNPANWDNGVPNGNYNALINNGQPSPFLVNLDLDATVANLSLDSGNVLNVLNGNYLNFQSSSGSTFTNSGTTILPSVGGITIASGNSLNMNGPGVVILSGPGSSISGATGTEILQNSSTILGNGTISNVQIQNAGLIVSSGGNLLINARTNSNLSGFGNLEVTSGTTMTLQSPANGGWPIMNATVNDGGTMVIASSLQADNSTITLDGSKSQTTLLLANSDYVNFTDIDSVIRMSDNSNNLIKGNAGTEELTPRTIIGAGTIENLVLGSFRTSSVEATGVNPLVITPSTTVLSEVGHMFASTGGTLILNADIDVRGGGPVTPNLYASPNSTVVVNGSVTNGWGVGVYSGATMSTRSFDNGNGDIGSTLVSGGVLSINGDLVNSSNLNFSGLPGVPHNSGFYVTAGGTLNVTGALTNQGTMGLNGNDVLRVGGSLNNSGALDLANHETVIVTGNITNGQNGNIVVHDGGGSIIAANVTNSGTMQFGANTSLLVAGDFTQTSTGILTDYVGESGALHSPFIDISGDAYLNGTLDLSLISSYTPKFGDTFYLVYYDDYNGMFSNVNGLNIGNGLEWELFYDPEDIRIVAENGPVNTPEPETLTSLILGATAILIQLKFRREKNVLELAV
jgi:hypothetical protein